MQPPWGGTSVSVAAAATLVVLQLAGLLHCCTAGASGLGDREALRGANRLLLASLPPSPRKSPPKPYPPPPKPPPPRPPPPVDPRCSLPAWRGGCSCNAWGQCVGGVMKPCKLVVGHFDPLDSDGQCPSALATMCQSDVYSIITVDFNGMFGGGGGGTPADAAKFCNAAGKMSTCMAFAASIQTCQAWGKRVLLSLNGNANLATDALAKAHATSMWNAFLGGRSASVWRPFGNVVLDGVNLMVTTGIATSAAAFTDTLRGFFVVGQKPYFLTASPTCVYPDAFLGPDSLFKQNTPLQRSWFDYVFVRFTASTCGIQLLGIPLVGTTGFNANAWGTWAATISVNKNVQVYLGVNALSVSANAVWNASQQMISNGQLRFGGVFIKDASPSVCRGSSVPGTVGEQMHSGC